MIRRILFTLFILSVSASASALESQTPQIFFKYGPGFDGTVCKNPDLIQPGEFAELTSMIPTLQSVWNSMQKTLFETAVTIVGKDFKRSEETATLFLCRDFPAMATPLLIWGYPFLSSARGTGALDPRLIIPIVFHEVLHIYVNDISAGMTTTPLFAKYRNESPLVLAHLHVFAVEQLVYTAIDPTGRYLSVARTMDESYGPDYAKAWSIVTVEGAQPFVDELRGL